MMRRVIRRRFVVMVGAALMLLALAFQGWLRPTWVSRGHVSVGSAGGCLECGWSSEPAVRGARGSWVLRRPMLSGSMALGPGSTVWPTSSTGAMRTSMGSVAATMRVSVVYIPLWPWAVVSGMTALWFWWRSPRPVAPGCCPTCGYELRGSDFERCPECGTARQAFAWRVLRRLLSCPGGARRALPA
jgi:hypothetical protein